MNSWNKVYFRPWVGKKFGNKQGKRLLILGESHYGSIGRDSTIVWTREYIQQKWNHRFWTNIMQVVDGRRYWEIDREDFWAKVAFYNYIQEPVGETPGIKPSEEMLERAKEPFFEILNHLKPFHILVLSKRLWENMTFNKDSQGAKLNLNGEERETWIYSYDGGSAKATWLPHPSYYFSAQNWHPWVLEFLKQ